MILISNGDNGKSTVQSGHTWDLINRLVDPKEFDLDFLKAFILTHSQFVDSLYLLNSLIEHFDKCFMDNSNNTNLGILRYILAY